MSNYTAIRELLKRFSGQENTFTVPKVFVQYTGDLTTAILLNQIVFLSDKSKRTDGFFYKTYKEWEEEVCLTERQVRHSVNKLKEKGIVETKLMKANGSPTVHYKLDYDKFVDSILTFCQIPILHYVSIQPNNMSETLTENTTETTTENTTNNTYSNEFERFWSIYPRKVDKKKAYKSFKTAFKNHPIETILTGTEKYAQSVQKTEQKFIKHPTTFLNNDSFIDGYEEGGPTNGKNADKKAFAEEYGLDF